MGGGAAAPWPSGELTRLEAGPGWCREWAGLLGTRTPAAWGSGRGSGDLQASGVPRKNICVTGLRGDPATLEGPGPTVGCTCSRSLNWLWLGGLGGPMGRVPRDQLARVLSQEVPPLRARAGHTSRVQGGLHGRPG